MTTSNTFEEAYKNLNKAQKEAVDSIEGPVMVVAGPGTGKTQILSLRIGNILKKTDITPDGILCLTFTNSGVSAMRERLERYIGQRSKDVNVSTFHSFAYDLVEKNYGLLSFDKVPKMLDDDEAVFLIDEILNNNDWEYISPRGNRAMYFSDLRHLVSILKRERIRDIDLLSYIEKEIKSLKEDPASISSRGESKGKIKKEVEKKIEQLGRTKEVVEFYRLYENNKKESSLMDFDDVLEYAVQLVTEYESVRDDVRENYLYILVDEHQDSSGIQNSFLQAVWKGVEKPNIFVVGDDRQLIYAFSGASLSYFEEFSDMFGKAKLIVLTENYRSTSPILSIADSLLQSTITNEKLKSNRAGDTKIMLNEYSYPRDEIIGAGLFFKEKIEKGIPPNECALLVPKNYQVRSAIQILSDLGLPVAQGKNLSLFSVLEADFFRNVLKIIVNPSDRVLLSKSLLSNLSGVSYLDAHNFLRSRKVDQITIEQLISFSGELFPSSISGWGNKLKEWINDYATEKPSRAISYIGNDLLIKNAKNNDELLNQVEIVRSFIHLATLYEEKNKKATLSEFLEYIDRLESYNTHIELAKFGNDNGIQVMTLHKSKGLEYECVWVAHMNEETLMSEKRNGFTLPEKIKEHINKRNIEQARRELYVAITRSKEFCTLSYAGENYTGNQMELAEIIKEIDDSHFQKTNKEETEKEIISKGVKVYTNINIEEDEDIVSETLELVKNNYRDIKVSVSMLNNFFECPWRWYFRNFLKLPEVKQLHLALGTTVHSMIELILKSGIPKDIESEIKFRLEDEGVLNSNDLRKLQKDAIDMIENWIENHYKNISQKFESEKSISFVKDGLTIYGKIDLVEYLSSGEIIVTDFKTGSAKTSGVIEKINEKGKMSDLMRQLTMYSYLFKDKKVTNSKLLFLEDNILYQTSISDEQVDLLKKDIKEYEDAVRDGSWIERECNFKPNSIVKECEYCKMWKTISRIT